MKNFKQENIHILKGHKEQVTQLKLCKDGRRAVTSSYDSTIRVWDIENGNCLHVLEGHREMIELITLHPDNKRIISSSRDRTIRVWNVDTGQSLGIINMSPRSFPADWVTDHYKFHPDGKHLITWNTYGYWIKIWDLDTFECLHVLKHNDYVCEPILHPDGKRLIYWEASDDKDSLFICNLQSGECLQSLKGYLSSIDGMELCPDGRRLLIWDRSADYDEEHPPKDPKGLIWDIETKKAVYLIGHKDLIYWIMSHPDGHRLISVGTDGVRVWDENNGECLNFLIQDKRVRHLQFHPDKQRLLAGIGKNMEIWDLDKGTCIHILSGHTDEVHQGYHVPHSNDKLLITYSYNEIRIWNIDNGKCIHEFKGHPDLIYDILPLNDGKHMLSKGGDLRLWNLETGKCLEVMDLQKEYIYGFILHPDGRRVISWSGDGTICIWHPSALSSTNVNIERT